MYPTGVTQDVKITQSRRDVSKSPVLSLYRNSDQLASECTTIDVPTEPNTCGQWGKKWSKIKLGKYNVNLKDPSDWKYSTSLAHRRSLSWDGSKRSSRINVLPAHQTDFPCNLDPSAGVIISVARCCWPLVMIFWIEVFFSNVILLSYCVSSILTYTPTMSLCCAVPPAGTSTVVNRPYENTQKHRKYFEASTNTALKSGKVHKGALQTVHRAKDFNESSLRCGLRELRDQVRVLMGWRSWTLLECVNHEVQTQPTLAAALPTSQTLRLRIQSPWVQQTSPTTDGNTHHTRQQQEPCWWHRTSPLQIHLLYAISLYFLDVTSWMNKDIGLQPRTPYFAFISDTVWIVLWWSFGCSSFKSGSIHSASFGGLRARSPSRTSWSRPSRTLMTTSVQQSPLPQLVGTGGTSVCPTIRWCTTYSTSKGRSDKRKVTMHVVIKLGSSSLPPVSQSLTSSASMLRPGATSLMSR